jgi:hypothetical protein
VADANTTYTAGTGLGLTGTQFSVCFLGTGAASPVARSDHNHDAAYIQNQSATAQAASANINGTLAVGGTITSSAIRNTGTVRLGSESIPNTDAKGLVIRRIYSCGFTDTIATVGTGMNIVRDGTGEGFRLDYPAGQIRLQVDCNSVTGTGTASVVHTGIAHTLTTDVAGSVPIYAAGANLAWVKCQLHLFPGGDTAEISLQRLNFGGTNNYCWSGSITSSVNQ